jgi:predicted SnoaL-like aldol condensation-catalyzing enzyme
MHGFTFRRRPGANLPGNGRRVAAAVAASVVFVGGVAACGGGSSVTSSPAGVVTTLFSDIQANNCDGAYAQMSSRLQAQLRGKAGVCPFVTQLSQRYRDNKFRVDSVVTNGNQATVKAKRTNASGTSRFATLITVVDKNAWKVDSIG